MLKGDVFAEQLFENQIFALFINTFLDGNNGVASDYKNSMALTYNGGDITIDSGAVCIQGRFLEEVTSTTISVSDTSKYHKLIIEIDLDKTNTATSLEQAYYKILTSASAYPSLTQTDIVKNVSGVYQYELAQFRTDSSGNITNWSDTRTFLDIASIYTQLQTEYRSILAELEEELQEAKDDSLYVLKEDVYYKIANTYLEGEEYRRQNEEVCYPGFISNGSKDLVFTITLPKKARTNQRVYFESILLKCRTISGYLYNMSESMALDFTTNIDRYTLKDNILTIVLRDENGWALDNNDPPTLASNNRPIMISPTDIDIYFY